jgi:hypothetical protein
MYTNVRKKTSQKNIRLPNDSVTECIMTKHTYNDKRLNTKCIITKRINTKRIKTKRIKRKRIKRLNVPDHNGGRRK